MAAGKQARILASSWSAAVEDAHQVIVVSLKSTPSLPTSPTGYMPQTHPWSAVNAAPMHLAPAPSAEQGEMSALQTLRRAKSYSREPCVFTLSLNPRS